jgi:uncharacterized protein YdcH (DUF465 family)
MAEAQLPLEGVRASLLGQDEAFRQLVSEHHALDERIRRLSSLPYLSLDEQYQEAALKKRKLALKDQIEAIVRRQAIAAEPS